MVVDLEDRAASPEEPSCLAVCLSGGVLVAEGRERCRPVTVALITFGDMWVGQNVDVALSGLRWTKTQGHIPKSHNSCCLPWWRTSGHRFGCCISRECRSILLEEEVSDGRRGGQAVGSWRLCKEG